MELPIGGGQYSEGSWTRDWLRRGSVRYSAFYGLLYGEAAMIHE